MVRVTALVNRAFALVRKSPVWLRLVAVAVAAGGLLYCLFKGEVSPAELAKTLGAAAILMALLIIPYCAAALLAFERDPRVKRTHRNRFDYYGPSLWITTWLTRVYLIVMVLVMAVLLIRIGLHYEDVGEVKPQPIWSLIINFIMAMLLLGALNLPATFLLWVKYQIVNLRYLPREENNGQKSKPL